MPGLPVSSALASRERYWSRTGGEAGWGRGGRAGLAPGGLSQRIGRQGGPSPRMLGEMVQECSSNPRPGPCPPHPGPSSLSSGSRDGRCLELCLVASARGLQRQPGPGDWPRDGQEQARAFRELGPGLKHARAHWVMRPAATLQVPHLQ